MNEADEALVALLEELAARVQAMPGETMATIQIRNTLPLMIEQIRERGEIFPDLPLDLPRHYIITYKTGRSYMVLTRDIGVYLARDKVTENDARTRMTGAIVTGAPDAHGVVNVLEVSDAAAAAWPDPIWDDLGVVRP